MSRPAISCARKCVDTASSYCSRQRALTIASRKLLLPNETVCHEGRGNEPIIEVGSRIWAEALYMHRPPSAEAGPAEPDRHFTLIGPYHLDGLAPRARRRGQLFCWFKELSIPQCI